MDVISFLTTSPAEKLYQICSPKSFCAPTMIARSLLFRKFEVELFQYHAISIEEIVILKASCEMPWSLPLFTKVELVWCVKITAIGWIVEMFAFYVTNYELFFLILSQTFVLWWVKTFLVRKWSGNIVNVQGMNFMQLQYDRFHELIFNLKLICLKIWLLNII